MKVLRTAILDFCRRKKGKPFCPTEVVQQMFPEDWELFTEEVTEEAIQMAKEEIIELSSRDPEGKVLVAGFAKPKSS
jgi:hypothetical protein